MRNSADLKGEEESADVKLRYQNDRLISISPYLQSPTEITILNMADGQLYVDAALLNVICTFVCYSVNNGDCVLRTGLTAGFCFASGSVTMLTKLDFSSELCLDATGDDVYHFSIFHQG